MIYAIIVCVASGSTDYCHPLGGIFYFRSEDQCTEVMRTRLGPGNLIGDKFYSSLGDRSGNVWYECGERPDMQWQPVR